MFKVLWIAVLSLLFALSSTTSFNSSLTSSDHLRADVLAAKEDVSQNDIDDIPYFPWPWI